MPFPEEELSAGDESAARSPRHTTWLAVIAAVLLAAAIIYALSPPSTNPAVGVPITMSEEPAETKPVETIAYVPRDAVDESGFRTVLPQVDRWSRQADSAQIAEAFAGAAQAMLKKLDRVTSSGRLSDSDRVLSEYYRAVCYSFDGRSDEAYEALVRCRQLLNDQPQLAKDNLYTIIYLQGLMGLRKGETENCIMCRGESSCIVPIAQAAVHQNEEGSRLAIRHFTEYLAQFPDDIGVRWLLNIAHMTLGEHPQKVDPRYVISLDTFTLDQSAGIGKFRDIGHKVGVNRLNLGGGGIMEDFDNDGLLDIFITSFDPVEHPALYLNSQRAKFTEATMSAGLMQERGGINCMQTDYDNDGDMDVLIVRGAWLLPEQSMPLSLLRNNGDTTFTNVTVEAGLGAPLNSIAAGWADYDNDGWLDVFVCNEYGPCLLYHNEKDGTFADRAQVAGVAGSGASPCKGVTWLDFDNDGYVDLFVNYMGRESAKFYVNNRDGTFTDREMDLGIDGPRQGFACWSWDYDNDGWLDIFATSYDRTLEDVVAGIEGKRNRSQSNRLFRNREGKGFENVTASAGLDQCYATMGSNFGDFDNDGYLDMYLGTGDPNYSMLVPNRMLRNLAGKKFADITASSGTGNLQKGHGTACGDWDQDGNVDLFVQMGGAVNGDKYHNILFQNPGHENAWITLKLIGTKTNRAAIGARIKVVTPNMTVCRTVTSGSSFGANPLEQTIGLGHAQQIDRIEIDWPVSGQKQILKDIRLRTRTVVEEEARS